MEKIYNILKEIRPEYQFEESDDFIEDGLLDSFDIISLVDLLETTFSIVINGLQIVPENFCSAEAIRELIIKNGGNI